MGAEQEAAKPIISRPIRQTTVVLTPSHLKRRCHRSRLQSEHVWRPQTTLNTSFIKQQPRARAYQNGPTLPACREVLLSSADESFQASESRLYSFSKDTESHLRKFRLTTSQSKGPQAVICTYVSCPSTDKQRGASGDWLKPSCSRKT